MIWRIFWQVFPQLKNELFEPKANAIMPNCLPSKSNRIFWHIPNTRKFKQRTLQPFTQWQHANNLRQIAQGNRLKELIHQWSEKPCLIATKTAN